MSSVNFGHMSLVLFFGIVGVALVLIPMVTNWISKGFILLGIIFIVLAIYIEVKK